MKNEERTQSVAMAIFLILFVVGFCLWMKHNGEQADKMVFGNKTANGMILYDPNGATCK